MPKAPRVMPPKKRRETPARPRPRKPPRKLTLHPVFLWRLQHTMKQRDFVDLVCERFPGIRFTQGYLSLIEAGLKVPSMKLATALSQVMNREASAKFIRDTTAKIGRQKRARAKREREDAQRRG